ncbi:MAG: tyrosine-type recombinase/integrase [Schlesneria sp.]
MLLLEWLPLYVSRQLDLEKTTIGTYEVAVNKFDRWKVDRDRSPCRTEDLSVPLVSDWLSHLTSEEKLKPKTVNSYRSSVNAVWSGAMKAGLSNEANNRLVPSCRVPHKIPIAWTLDELRLLVEAAKAKKGRRKNRWNTLRRDFWLGLYLFLYDTGARFGAALALECQHVNIRRNVVTLQAESSKTKTDQLVSISDETAEILERLIADGHELVFPNGVNRQELYDEHKRTLQSVGLPFDRYHMFHCIRKTTATQLSIASSIEEASKTLGHTSTRITKRTYVDSRQLPFVRASQLLPRPTDDPDDDGARNIIKFPAVG